MATESPPAGIWHHLAVAYRSDPVLRCATLIVFGVIFVKTQMTHHTRSGPPAKVEPSGDELLDSIRRGVEYLKVHQETDGEFSAGLLDPKPAFTAMVIDALSRTPDRYDEKTPFVAKAVKAILSHQQDDGSICSLGFGCYVTSVSAMALERMNNPAHKDVMDKALAAEAAGPVLNASVFGGFPLSDIPHVGLGAVVATDGADPAGPALLRDMLSLAWMRRAEFVYQPEPLERSIAHAKTLEGGPIVLADHGDNSGAGGQCDNMAALAEALQ